METDTKRIKKDDCMETETVIEMEEGSEAFNAIGNSDLGPHRNNSVRKEHFLIRRELRRLGIRKARQYEPEKLVRQ